MTKRSRAKVFPTRPEDIETLLEDGLRPQDVAEIAALGRTPREALLDAASSCGVLVFTVFVDGRAAGIFGAMATDIPGVGAIWMLGTNNLLKVRREFAIEGARWIDFFNAVYPILTNFVDERNEVSIRWLERLGFEFPYVDDFVTAEGVVFRRFERCAKSRPLQT